MHKPCINQENFIKSYLSSQNIRIIHKTCSWNPFFRTLTNFRKSRSVPSFLYSFGSHPCWTHSVKSLQWKFLFLLQSSPYSRSELSRPFARDVFFVFAFKALLGILWTHENMTFAEKSIILHHIPSCSGITIRSRSALSTTHKPQKPGLNRINHA